MAWGGPEYVPPAEQRAAEEAAQAAADAEMFKDHRNGVLADAIKVGLFVGLFEIADAIRDAAGIVDARVVEDDDDDDDPMQDDLDADDPDLDDLL